jgi:hypothetical protein
MLYFFLTDLFLLYQKSLPNFWLDNSLIPGSLIGLINKTRRRPEKAQAFFIFY